MTKPRAVRLTEKQEEYIKKTKIGFSDFIKRSVDHYILYRENPYVPSILAELESWIQEKKSVNVLQYDTNVSQTNTNVSQTNTNVSDTNTNVAYCNTESMTHQDKSTENTIANVLHSELQMLQRLLQNPANVDSIPDDTLKMLSKKYALSKPAIQGWIVENKQWLKESNFGEDEAT